ncbi:MAG TPA: DUF4230 domain-containing protein [Thermoanaerobaculia bacterium]|nr:DUF4230 domain-containing protein [Thermoanaerobaculia bacterium]
MPERAKRFLILAFLLFAVGFTLWHIVREAPRMIAERVTQRFIGKKEEQVDLAALVTQVRELSRLETASMRVMHISTSSQSYGMVPKALSGDSIQFMAVGDVIAGVDLSSMRREDVAVSPDGTLTMKLPPAQVLVTRVDNRESRVMSRQTGLLRKQDIHLESRARAHAESGIKEEALRKGILMMASANGEKKMADFLHTVGFQKVRFEKRAASGGG